MDTTQYQDEGLRQLLRQLPVDKPAADFSSRVMAQVMIEAQRAQKQQHRHRIVLYSAIACFAVVLLTLGLFFVIRYFNIGLGSFGFLLTSLRDVFSAIADLTGALDDKKIILIGAVSLLLLLGDLFIRRGIERRKMIQELKN